MNMPLRKYSHITSIITERAVLLILLEDKYFYIHSLGPTSNYLAEAATNAIVVSAQGLNERN